MKTSLTTGIASISISVLFWAIIVFTNMAQVGGDSSTAIAWGLAWFFLGCPTILLLTVISLMNAFTKSPVQPMKTAKIVSLISAACFVAPFIFGTLVMPLING